MKPVYAFSSSRIRFSGMRSDMREDVSTLKLSSSSASKNKNVKVAMGLFNEALQSGRLTGFGIYFLCNKYCFVQYRGLSGEYPMGGMLSW